MNQALTDAAGSILTHFFSVQSGRRVAILFDAQKVELAEALWSELIARGSHPEMVEIVSPLSELPPETSALLRSSAHGLIVLSSHRMWSELGLHQLFRHEGGPKLAVACKPVFFDEVMPLDSVLRVYSSNPDEDRAYLETLRRQMSALSASASTTRITAPGGTDISFVPRAWTLEGRELLTSPVEESVNGIVVADVSVYLGKVSAPVTLAVEGGRLTEIGCGNSADLIFQLYRSEMLGRREVDPRNAQLAEVAFGGNAKAEVSGCIMEDESVRDTCHFCFGDNSRYGGPNRVAWHGGTVVVRSPSIG